MPSPLRIRKNFSKFFRWLEPVVRNICDHPSHMQRLSIIGAGMVMFPTVIAFAMIVWLGYGKSEELQAQSLNFMGAALLASMALWGLVVVAILGVVKGVSMTGPGGVSVAVVTTADDPDVDPTTTRDVNVGVSVGTGEDNNGGYGNDRGGFGGFGGRRDNRGGRPMPGISE